jgi:hypothetical protein
MNRKIGNSKGERKIILPQDLNRLLNNTILIKMLQPRFRLRKCTKYSSFHRIIIFINMYACTKHIIILYIYRFTKSNEAICPAVIFYTVPFEGKYR